MLIPLFFGFTTTLFCSIINHEGIIIMQKQQEVKLRLVRMMEQPFRLHYEEAFDDPKAESAIMSSIPGYEEFLAAREKLRETSHKAPVELRGFYEEPLLEREQEYHWFRQFNFLKYKAKCILQSADPLEPVAMDVENAEKLLNQAALIKHQLAHSNIRLVMKIAKGQKEYIQNPSIDLLAEIISDGYLGLVTAVDYFDYRLGNKFSTYAYWVIREIMERNRKSRAKHAGCLTGMDEAMAEIPEREHTEERPIATLLKEVHPVERQIISDYYGLETGKGMTLQKIADKRGLSKERVRQLKERGLEKIRNARA